MNSHGPPQRSAGRNWTSKPDNGAALGEDSICFCNKRPAFPKMDFFSVVNHNWSTKLFDSRGSD